MPERKKTASSAGSSADAGEEKEEINQRAQGSGLRAQDSGLRIQGYRQA
jgi:hypothetical protein